MCSVKTKDEEKRISTTCTNFKPHTPFNYTQLISSTGNVSNLLCDGGLKSTCGVSKHSLQVVSVRYSKCPMLEPESLLDKLVPSMMKRCGQILMKLIKHKFGWVFNKLVNVVGLRLHDYHKMVKQSMDLGGVKFWLTVKHTCHHLISVQMLVNFQRYNVSQSQRPRCVLYVGTFSQSLRRDVLSSPQKVWERGRGSTT